MMRRQITAFTVVAVLFASPFRAAAQEPQPDTAAGRERGGPPAAAEPDPRSTQGGELRVLNGHHFITPLAGTSPMLNTSFALAQGFGVLKAGDSDIFAYTQVLGMTAGFGNRVAVDVDVSGIAALNSNLDTILYLAGIAQLSAAVTPKVRVLTLEDVGFQLTAGLGASYERQLVVQPVGILQALDGAETVDDVARNLDANDIFAQGDTISVAPVVAMAEGVGPFGVQASASPSIAVAGSSPGGGDFSPSASLDLAAQVAFDFYELGAVVPLAVTAGYGPDIPLGDGDLAHAVTAGLWYSRSRDFNMGVAFNGQFADGIDFYGGIMALQYFF